MKGQGAFKRDQKRVVRRIGVSESREVKLVVVTKNRLNQKTRDYLDALGG